MWVNWASEERLGKWIDERMTLTDWVIYELRIRSLVTVGESTSQIIRKKMKTEGNITKYECEWLP